MTAERDGPEHEAILELADAAATEALGARLVDLGDDAVVLLEGDLGAGKTTLVRGFLQALGHGGRVRSPTYTLVETYEVTGPAGPVAVAHFDLYRLVDPEELEEIGFRDYLAGRGWRFVEWPERAAGALPEADLVITLSLSGDGRRAHLRARGEAACEWLRGLDDARAAFR
ncbi:MAG TPA: tRNA (adenosine(37)-N6)-threonylcarbamoyltransferase complex ATPase subunit type 1 TsaE [Pseudomonadales bacterium]|nr:tRNA (adenosine(37)-N6)-threonylcarbamoyltransferase complex ATPase subunit type 1 TsaE [Pseudomonadales bacterium]